MAKQVFRVYGMHCPSCEKMLEMDIRQLKGVSGVKADYQKGQVSVDGNDFEEKEIRRAIAQNGYRV